jgi:hypothetical protein
MTDSSYLAVEAGVIAQCLRDAVRSVHDYLSRLDELTYRYELEALSNECSIGWTPWD